MLKHFKSILKDQSGMSLVEVMVAVGISSVVSMGVMKINETATKGMNHTSTKFNLQEFQRGTLALTLSKPEHCKANFMGKSVAADLTSSNFNSGGMIIRQDGSMVTSDVAPNNKTPEGDWTINPGSMVLRAIVKDSGGQTGICNLEMTLTRNKMAFGGTTQSIRLPLYCMVDAGDLITTCMAASAANSDIWQMNYKTGYEFINYLPASGLGYVVIGGDPAGNVAPMVPFDVNASLTINQDGFDWRGFPPYKEGVKMPLMNVITWDRWGISEGVSHTAGASQCFKMANFPTDTTLNQQAEFCPTFLSTQSLNGANYNNHIIANRGGISLLPWDTTATNATTVRLDNRNGSFVIDYNFQKLDTAAGTVSIARGASANGNGGAVIEMKSSGTITMASLPATQVENVPVPMLYLDPMGIIGANNSIYYATSQINDFNFGTTRRTPSIIIGHTNSGGLSTDTAPATPHGTEGSLIIGAGNVARSQSSIVMGLSNDIAKVSHYSNVMGTFNLITGTGGYHIINGDQNIVSNSGYSLTVGNSNLIQGVNSISIGSSNWINGTYSQTIGKTNVANANYSMAIGQNNLAASVYSYAHGYANEAGGIGSFAFGNTNQALGNYSFAFGMGSKAESLYSMAYGYEAEAKQVNSIAIGYQAKSRAQRSVAMGYQSEIINSTALNAVAIGTKARATNARALALGNRSQAVGAGSIAISAAETDADAQGVITNGTSAVGIGRQVTVEANNSIGIGNSGNPAIFVEAPSTGSIAMGSQVRLSLASTDTTAIGTNLRVDNCKNCTLIGRSPWTTELLKGAGSTLPGPVGQDNTTRIFAARRIELKVQLGVGATGCSTENGPGPAPCSTSTGYNTGGQIAFLQAGLVGWQWTSDRNVKENFEELDEELVMDNLVKLGVTSWNYKGAPKKTRTIGPMAQDVYSLFTVPLGLETDNVEQDQKTVSDGTIKGILLVATKGLIKKTKSLEQENIELKREVANLKAEQASIKAALCQINAELEICK